MIEEQSADYSKSVTKIGSNLLVAIPAELTDACIRSIRDAVSKSAYDSAVTGAVLNFAMVTMMDSSIYQEMRKLSAMLSLMGVRVVWAGLGPGVVCALADLGVPLDDKTIATASSLDQGLALVCDQSKGRK
ncbi:MAG TPA: hypothetical protein PK537_04705 [Candidatus Limiplasma sp.]|nr:hypothetical protein [Candidatus Limiplasma sp.]